MRNFNLRCSDRPQLFEQSFAACNPEYAIEVHLRWGPFPDWSVNHEEQMILEKLGATDRTQAATAALQRSLARLN